MQSSQKPHVENNHNYLRDIIPNRVSLALLSQADLDLAFSHINSTPRKILGGKSPLEVFSFLHGEETARLLGITQIERDKVTLKPYLLKHPRKYPSKDLQTRWQSHLRRYPYPFRRMELNLRKVAYRLVFLMFLSLPTVIL